MFSIPTLFVVGAGANAELGMPTGADLKERIGKALNFQRGKDGLLQGDKQLYALLGERFRTKPDPYFDGGIQLSQLIHKFDSIDEALHWFSSRTEIVALGKATIVKMILEAERSSKLFNPSDSNLAKNSDYSLAWTTEFLSMAIGSYKREEFRAFFSRTIIINFNYDRAVEHFLYSELQNKFGFAAEEAKNALAGLKIIRPYGRVAPLPWQADAGAISFGTDFVLDHDKLFAASNNIQTYTEQSTSAAKSEIQSAIDATSVIVILGFGFHQQNMSLLQAARPNGKRIFATVHRLDPENYASLKRNIARTFQSNSPLEPHLLDRVCVNLLLTMKPSIMAPV